MNLISIIVPIYNAERFLTLSVDSVLAQSYQDFELLLINDGSTDNSAQICDEYAKSDARIRVFHTENGGVSSARNCGLDNARGKYVMFLDADDYWYDKTALEQLLKAADTYDLDIVRGEYKAVDQAGKNIFETPLTKSKQELSNKIIDSSILYTEIMRGENFLFLSLFKKCAIKKLRFNKNRVFLEDMEFFAHLLCDSLRCMFIPLRFYAYRKHPMSASHTIRLENLADSFSMCDVFRDCTAKTNNNILQHFQGHGSLKKVRQKHRIHLIFCLIRLQAGRYPYLLS